MADNLEVMDLWAQFSGQGISEETADEVLKVLCEQV